MKRRGFIALFLIICLSLVFVSCDADSGNGNGKIVSLNFEAPGVFAYRENKRAALVDYTYTVNNYKVYANYSNGYREDVTQVAKITSNDSVEVGKGNTLTFKEQSDSEGNVKNDYSLTLEYAGITLPVTAWAYLPGDPIDGLRNVKTKFYEGELLSSFAEISMLDKEGNYLSTTSLLPSSYVGFVMLNKENKIVNLSSNYTFVGEEQQMYYVTYLEESSKIAIAGFDVLDYKDEDVKSIKASIFSKYPSIGDAIPSSDQLVKEYASGQRGRVYLMNESSFLVEIVDKTGNVNSGFNVLFEVKKASGNSESGTYEKGDTITEKVTFKGKDYTYSYTLGAR